MKQNIFSNEAPKPIGPYSQAIKIGKMIFVSGQIAIDPRTNLLIIDNIQAETKMVMENIKNILKVANCSLNDVVKCSIFLSKMEFFDSVNNIYGSYFSTPYPARETIEVNCLPKNVNVEISVIAITK